ncbi:MAG: tetratricopeptide repeat protein, partial [Candidatus Hodarchaeales archaeon]
MTEKQKNESENNASGDNILSSLRNSGNYREIIKYFEEIKPDNPSSYSKYIEALIINDCLSDARTFLTNWSTKAKDLTEKAYTSYNEGLLAYNNNDQDSAINLFKTSLKLCAQVSTDIWELEGLVSQALGRVYNQIDNYDLAIYHVNRSLTLFRENDDFVDTGVALDDRGFVYWRMGQVDSAFTDFKESYDILMSLNNKFKAQHPAGHLGLIYRTMGQYKKALDYAIEAIDLAKQVNSRHGKWSNMFLLATIKRDLGQVYEARKLLEEAIGYLKGFDRKNSFIWSYIELGNVYYDIGNPDKALNYMNMASEIALSIKHYRSLAEIIFNSIRIKHEQNVPITEQDFDQFPKSKEDNEVIAGFQAMIE